MIRVGSLKKECRELFASFPLAVEPVSHGRGAVQSMVLMLQDGDDARFYTLSRHSERRPYQFRSWPSGSTVDIGDDRRGTVPDEVVSAVTLGVPVPRNGSLFGWMHGDAVSTLVAVRTKYSPALPTPSWALMPLADLPETQWPRFTGERFLGPWFWEAFRAGRIVLLADLIANNPATIYWVDTKATLGSACCAVTHDVTSHDGYRLRGGRYVYYKVLRAGTPVPPLAALLEDKEKVDLAPAFQ